MRERLISAAVVAAVATMVTLAFVQHWHVLTSSPYPLGIDGYFYPIQVRALLEHNALQYPASPLTFWFMAPFAAATDPITGAKLGAALGTAMIAVPAYGVGAHLGHGRGPGLLAAALASASASSAYLAIEFVKQGLGLTLALAALWCLLRVVARPTWPCAALAAAAFLATLATHKLAAAILGAMALPVAVAEVRALLRGRRLLYVTLAAAAAMLALIVLGILAPQRFVSPTDLALVGELVTSTARWSAPALVTPQLELTFGHEAALAGGFAILALLTLVGQVPRARWRPRIVWWVLLPLPMFLVWCLRRLTTIDADTLPVAALVGADRSRVIKWTIIGLALVIALPWLAVTDPQGLGFRLRLAAFVPLALCAAVVAHKLLAFTRPLVRDAILAAVAAAVVAYGCHQPHTEGEVDTHPALAAAVMAATDQVPSNATVIVPERHILFMVAWYTRAPVSLRAEPIPYAERVRMFGLVFIGGPGSPMDRALDAARRESGVTPPLGLHPGHRNGLVLVTEPTWDWLLAHLPPRAHDYFKAWPTI